MYIIIQLLLFPVAGFLGDIALSDEEWKAYNNRDYMQEKMGTSIYDLQIEVSQPGSMMQFYIILFYWFMAL